MSPCRIWGLRAPTLLYCSLCQRALSLISSSKGRRGERDREDKKEEDVTKEAEETPPEVQPFSPPGDPQLIKDIDEVRDRIQPLPTTRDQVAALAQ